MREQILKTLHLQQAVVNGVSRLRVAAGNEDVQFDSPCSSDVMVSGSPCLFVNIHNVTAKAHHLDRPKDADCWVVQWYLFLN